jgi:hypothetical protein
MILAEPPLGHQLVLVQLEFHQQAVQPVQRQVLFLDRLLLPITV